MEQVMVSDPVMLRPASGSFRECIVDTIVLFESQPAVKLMHFRALRVSHPFLGHATHACC